MGQEIVVDSWEECEKHFQKIEADNQGNPLGVWFRGQSDFNWNLLSTLERRTPAAMPVSEYFRLIANARPEIEAFTGASWEIYDRMTAERGSREYDQFHNFIVGAYSYLTHLRHNGFPSPLLDWTRSPYVAAYFAFATAHNTEYVSIYAFSERPSGMKTGGSNKSSIFAFGPLVKTHPRHFRQQSRYTICAEFNKDRGWLFVPHQSVFDRGNINQDVLWKIKVPAKERMKIISLLDRFNLNAFSLFGSEESLMETLAFREIDLRHFQ